MKAAPLLAILLCALAANDGFLLRAAHARALQPEAPLPVPPIPPTQPPPMTAPMPDVDAPVPYAEAWRSPVTLYTGLNHRESPSLGSGFAPGARYQIDNDRRLLNLPGIMLRLPFP
jgi:hypothetical protein